MSKCEICYQSKSPYILNNRSVCMHCDALLFEIEIELDDEIEQHSDDGHLSLQQLEQRIRLKG